MAALVWIEQGNRSFAIAIHGYVSHIGARER